MRVMWPCYLPLAWGGQQSPARKLTDNVAMSPYWAGRGKASAKDPEGLGGLLTQLQEHNRLSAQTSMFNLLPNQHAGCRLATWQGHSCETRVGVHTLGAGSDDGERKGLVLSSEEVAP